MAHPFQDRLVVFIGTPQRCTRQAARDALIAVGGIPDAKIVCFTSFVVAFGRADTTKVYQHALKFERDGLLTVLTEAQFFDILEGRAAPPEKPKPDKEVIVIPPEAAEAVEREFEQIKTDTINRRRMDSLARYGVQTPDGRMKIDLRPLDNIRRVMKIIKDQE